jgi:hypothetical protein
LKSKKGKGWHNFCAKNIIQTDNFIDKFFELRMWDFSQWWKAEWKGSVKFP